MNNHANEVLEKANVPEKDKERSQKVSYDENRKKCHYENVGLCNKKDQCNNFHPTTTCQSHSKLGSCSSESNCPHRHPNRTCFSFQRYGSCNRGNYCKFRHPIELSFGQSRESFLGNNQYGSRNRYQDSNHKSYRHHGNFRPSHNNYHQSWQPQISSEPNQHQPIFRRSRMSPDNIRHHDLKGSRW